MTTTTRKRRVHIDAPVETVFDYVQDPQHWFEALPENHRAGVTMTDVIRTPDGVVSTYGCNGSLLFFHIHVTLTREEYILNERIVDHSSAGPVFTYTFEPDPSGTTLSLMLAISTKVPLLDKVAATSFGDRDVDTMLDQFKEAIES